MTYPDEYYKNTIQPAKAGTGPVPSKTQMMYQNLKSGGPFKAMMIGADPYLPGFMQQGYDKFRAAPTQAVKNIAGTLGKGITSLASLPAQAAMFTLGSTPANADEANMTPEDFAALNAAQNTISPTTNRNFDRDFSQLPSYGDAISRTNVQGMDLEMDPGAFMNPNIQPSQNMFQRAGNAIQGGLGSIRDFAVDKGMSAKNLLGSGAAYAMGLPGIVGSGAMSLLGGLSNMFERRDGMATVDEFGNLISGADLDKQNALGGYYTDAARASRRRGKSIQTMLARQTKEGLSRLGQKRLEKLLADQKKQDDARQAAFNSIMSQGNNQQSFYDSLNQGSGSTAVSGNPNTSGAGDAPGYSGPSTFADGGLASMFVRRG